MYKGELMHFIIVVSIVVLMIGGFVVVATYRDNRAMNTRRKLLSTRPQMDMESWYCDLYAPIGISRSLAIEVVSLLANVLGCKLTQIYPDDTFDNELSLKIVWFIQIDPDDESNYFFDVELPKLLTNNTSEKEVSSLIQNCGTIGDLLSGIDRIRSRK